MREDGEKLARYCANFAHHIAPSSRTTTRLCEHAFKARPHDHALAREDTKWPVNKAPNGAGRWRVMTQEEHISQSVLLFCHHSPSSRSLFMRHLVSSRASAWSCGRAFRTQPFKQQQNITTRWYFPFAHPRKVRNPAWMRINLKRVWWKFCSLRCQTELNYFWIIFKWLRLTLPLPPNFGDWVGLTRRRR